MRGLEAVVEEAAKLPPLVAERCKLEAEEEARVQKAAAAVARAAEHEALMK